LVAPPAVPAVGPVVAVVVAPPVLVAALARGASPLIVAILSLVAISVVAASSIGSTSIIVALVGISASGGVRSGRPVGGDGGSSEGPGRALLFPVIAVAVFVRFNPRRGVLQLLPPQLVRIRPGHPADDLTLPILHRLKLVLIPVDATVNEELHGIFRLLFVFIARARS